MADLRKNRKTNKIVKFSQLNEKMKIIFLT